MFAPLKNRNLMLGSLAAGLALLLSATLLPGLSAARMGKTAGPDPDRAVARLTDKLDLTEEQQAQVRTILEEGSTERDALHEEMRTRMDDHHDAMHERMAKVLTEDQMQRFDEMREHGRSGRGDCWGGDRDDCSGGRHMGRMGAMHGGRGDCGYGFGHHRGDCGDR